MSNGTKAASKLGCALGTLIGLPNRGIKGSKDQSSNQAHDQRLAFAVLSISLSVITMTNIELATLPVPLLDTLGLSLVNRSHHPVAIDRQPRGIGVAALSVFCLGLTEINQSLLTAKQT